MRKFLLMFMLLFMVSGAAFAQEVPGGVIAPPGAMSGLEPSIVGAVANENFKSVSSHAAQYANMIMGNSVANQQAAQGILTKSLGNSLASMDRIGLTESAAIRGMSGNELANLIMMLTASRGAGEAIGP